MRVVDPRRQAVGRAGSPDPVRALFWATVLWGAILPWLAPHPPMVDLPQHAGQVALLRELLAGTSPWADLLRINVFTPYWLGYGLALPLTALVPIVTALKLLLSIAYVAFVAAGVALRRRLGGDGRLDWLFVPSFFGLAWEWGFFTFLLAAPAGLAFLILAADYAERPRRRGLWLALAGALVFGAHALVFLLAMAVGGLMLVLRQRWAAAYSVWPYALLGALSSSYLFWLARDETVPVGLGLPDWGSSKDRLLSFPLISWDASHPLFLVFSAIALVAPFVLGSRINRPASALAPFGVVIAIWAAVPTFALNTGFLYERFALFFLPFYALVFRPRPGAEPAGARRRTLAGTVLLAGCCWTFFGIESVRLRAFAREAQGIDALIASAPPGRRALGIVHDATSAATGSLAYFHYALWYQAERAGFVEFNFAWFHPQVVRYRPGRFPPIDPSFNWLPDRFDWETHQARNYGLFFVRLAPGQSPLDPFKDAPCPPAVLDRRDDWVLLEGRC